MGNLSQLLSECASFVKMAWLSHPPLQSPTRLLWVTPWAREESPRRVDAEETLRQRSGARPKSPI